MPQIAASLLIAQVLLAPGIGTAATYYVSGTGSDRNNGLSAAAPLRHLQTAADLTRPGDTVMVMNGTYTPAEKGARVLNIRIPGNASAWITYQAAPGQHPVINFTNGKTGIHIDAAYIIIDGFEVAGGAQHVTLAYAKAHAKDLTNYLTSAIGINIDPNTNGRIPHHVVIRNNIVHDAPSDGIDSCYADYITIQHNTVYSNAFWSPFGDSGISIWEMRDVDDYTGYKNYIVDNVSYNNRTFIPEHRSGKIQDGNGIIVDDNKNTQSTNVAAYRGRTYVANNIVYENGGAGIHVYSCQHVDVLNNTAWMNNQSPQINDGEISANSAGDVNILNNISYAPPGKVFYNSGGNDSSVVYDFNLLFSTRIKAGRFGSPLGPHDIVADPIFVATARHDFHLKAGSPAIDSGTASLAPSTDFDGNHRPAGAGFDRGAYEFQPAELREGRSGEGK